MNKKYYALLAAVLACLALFAGCKKTEEPVTPPVTNQPSTNQPSTTNPPTETTKTGIITEASMHYVQIEAPDGTTYSFAVSDDTKTDGKGENLGDTLQVTFDGEYKPMTLAQSIKVMESSKAVTVDPNDDGHIRYIVGVVEDASMHVVSVSWHNTVYNIAKDDNTEVEGEIALGATVEVYHKGNIQEGVLATKIVVKKAPEAPVVAEENTMTGVILDASNSNISIRARDGETYQYNKDDNTVVEAPLEIGKTVKITANDKNMATKIVAGTIAAQN